MMDLTKIDKPFGELDDATKGARMLLARLRGEKFEYTTGNGRKVPLHVAWDEVATFPTRDGQHVPGVYTSPDGLQIKIEVAK